MSDHELLEQIARSVELIAICIGWLTGLAAIALLAGSVAVWKRAKDIYEKTDD